jgi:hypothetical protein
MIARSWLDAVVDIALGIPLTWLIVFATVAQDATRKVHQLTAAVALGSSSSGALPVAIKVAAEQSVDERGSALPVT